VYCGNDLSDPTGLEAHDVMVCPHCRSSSTLEELIAAADARLMREVDSALSRVRSVKRRYPDR
jgi:hypothetical protein